MYVEWILLRCQYCVASCRDMCSAGCPARPPVAATSGFGSLTTDQPSKVSYCMHPSRYDTSTIQYLVEAETYAITRELRRYEYFHDIFTANTRY